MDAFGDGPFEGRDAVYAEHGRDRYFHCDFGTMIRTREWKCVRFSGTQDGQLFDLRADPEQENDLWRDLGHKETRSALLDRIAEWRTLSHVRTKDWAGDFR